jgi:hypothetical protein
MWPPYTIIATWICQQGAPASRLRSELAVHFTILCRLTNGVCAKLLTSADLLESAHRDGPFLISHAAKLSVLLIPSQPSLMRIKKKCEEDSGVARPYLRLWADFLRLQFLHLPLVFRTRIMIISKRSTSKEMMLQYSISARRNRCGCTT